LLTCDAEGLVARTAQFKDGAIDGEVVTYAAAAGCASAASFRGASRGPQGGETGRAGARQEEAGVAEEAWIAGETARLIGAEGGWKPPGR
jgi:hypothetical protein